MLEKYFLWLLAGIFNFWAAGVFYFPFQEMTKIERTTILISSSFLKILLTLVAIRLLRKLWTWILKYLIPKILAKLQHTVGKIESYPMGYTLVTGLRKIGKFLFPMVKFLVFLITLPLVLMRYLGKAISIAREMLFQPMIRGVTWIRNSFFSSTQTHPLLIRLIKWVRKKIKSPWVQASIFAFLAPWFPGGLSSTILVAQAKYGTRISLLTFVPSGVLWSYGLMHWAEFLHSRGLGPEEAKEMLAGIIPWIV